MKRFSFALMGALLLTTHVSLAGGASATAPATGARTAQTAGQAAARPVQMMLSAEKKVMERDEQGKPKIAWQALSTKPTVQPADTLRYTVRATNRGELPVKGLSITQPIPKGTRYVLHSATAEASAAAKVVYSIDNGKSFVEQPTIKVTLPNGKVEVRPAPADAYTHVCWRLANAIDPTGAARVSYQVTVR